MRSTALLILAVILAACGGSETAPPAADPYEAYAFEPLAFDAEPDVQSDRLCSGVSDPEAVADEVFIDCATESASFAADAAPKDSIVIAAYNLERGFEVDAQIDVLRDLVDPDVLLLSEADRGCERTGHRNIPREIAQALGMDYVYAVEFVELPRPGISEPCEHGNAVASRYPIGNVEVLRHTVNKSWYEVAEEPRLGGRVLLVADIQIGQRFLHVGALHFESSPVDNDITVAQAIETAEVLAARPFGAVPGGDTNAPFYFIDLLGNGEPIDLVTLSFFERGYVDAHAPLEQRATVSDASLVLDILFGNQRYFQFADPGICPKDVCSGLSDHLPVYATINFDP